MMVTKLVLPSCERDPTHPNHPPQLQKPLRIQVMGMSKHIDSLFDDGAKIPQEAVQTPGVDSPGAEFDETGLRFAKMAFKLLYGRDPNPDVAADFVPRHQHSTFPKVDEYEPGNTPVEGYCVTFDHLVDPVDDDPETLMMNLCDPADPQSATYFELDLAPYATGSAAPVVLLVPRCCQLRKGTTDRQRINGEVKVAKEGFRPPTEWEEVQ